MKNEIDDLLTAMFRNGVLNVKKPAATPSLVWDPAEDEKKANSAVQSVERAASATTAKLQTQIDELTRQANAELTGLESALKQDGVEAVQAVNAGAPQQVDAAFLEAGHAAAEQVLGQDAFLAALGVALRRPFVVGTGEDAPLGRVLVRGGTATGRHSALHLWVEELYRRGVVKSPKLAVISLEAYSAAGAETLFLQDFFSALKSGAVGVVFEQFEQAHPAVLSLVAELFCTGKLALERRFAEQKGMLVEIGSALVAGAISSLSAAGKYLFLLTDRDDARLADAFGMPFLDALDDICETKPFAPEVVQTLANRTLEHLTARCKKQLSISLTVEPEAESTLAAQYRAAQGVYSLQEPVEQLYRAVSEYRLKAEQTATTGKLTAEGGRLCASLSTGGTPMLLFAEEDVETEARDAAVSAVKRELEDIVGLRTVKDTILSLEDHFLLQQLRREQGLKADSPAMHMIFTGNPGTGKTTVARIVARYLKAIGILRGGQLVEVTRADLVGQYVGHTAPLTQKAIDSALGGVLFIDEAYALYRGEDDHFGLEAIDTLVKGMEDHRDELLVILAGYTHEMEHFLSANSGLRSRFPNVIEFPDYTAEELVEITKSIANSKGYHLHRDCDAILRAYYAEKQKTGDPRTNGNGRMARNTLEAAILALSRRVLQTPPEQRNLELLLPEDITAATEKSR